MNKITYFTLGLLGLAACQAGQQDRKSVEALDKQVGTVEITTFHLKQGVTVADFEAAAALVQRDFLEKQAGFISRTLTHSSDSLWTDRVSWKDQESFENAMKQAETSEAVLPFMEKIDFESVKMKVTPQ